MALYSVCMCIVGYSAVLLLLYTTCVLICYYYVILSICVATASIIDSISIVLYSVNVYLQVISLNYAYARF